MADRKRILITGVSRGLGRALTDALVAAGHTVIGCARSAPAVWELQQAHGSPHRFDTLDLRDDEAVGRWCRSVLAEQGAPDLLINNAGVINRNAPLWEVPLDEFRQLVDVNLVAVFSVIRHLLPAMIEAGSGIIVNLSSGWGRSVSAEVAPYCMTKWGIEGLTRALAAELPDGLAAIPVNPGVIDTDMLRSCFGESASAHDTASEWAKKAAPFLLSLTADNNGEPLSVPA